MKSLSFSSFTKKIFINTDVSTLYKLWTSSEGLCSWFLSKADFERNNTLIDSNELIAKGDKYTWFWHNWDGNEKGEVLDLKQDSFVKYTFAGGNDLLISFEQHDKAVLLSLTQSNIPTDDKSKHEIYFGCSNGWTFWLTNLKAFVEHGILLNERSVDLRGIELSEYEFVNM